MGIIQKPTVLKEYQQHLRGLCLKVLKETRETMNETILFEYPHRWNKVRFFFVVILQIIVGNLSCCFFF